MGCAASTSRHDVAHTHGRNHPKERRRSKSSSSSSSSCSDSSFSSKNKGHKSKSKNNQQLKKQDSKLLMKDTYMTKSTVVVVPHPSAPAVITINIETLHRYITLEKTIRSLENKNITAQHLSSKEELDAVCKHIDQLNSVPPTPGEDYDTALENHNRTLMSLHGQKAHLESAIKSLVEELQALQKAMDERDDLLEALFGGCYGSSLEDQLEEEYIRAANKLGHIRAFYQHWKAAIMYTQKAFEQISTGYQFWQRSFPKNFPQFEDSIASGQIVPEQIAQVTNARSWFVASSTNLGTSVRICLETLKVNIPYCQPIEIETLNKAIHHIFIDAKTSERHLHAGKVYYSMGTRTGGLYKWLETVLNSNINTDLNQAVAYHKQCQEALSNERHRLIRLEVENKLGADALKQFDLDISEARQEADLQKQIRDEKSETDSIAFAQFTEVTEPEQTLTTDDTKDEDKITAIPLNELAPAPSRAQIYGHMFALMEESTEAENRIKQMEQDAKKKQSQALQDKLASRRRRKLD